MITVTTKLSVKELAPVLGKSVGFIYKARMVGLPMEWDEKSRCLVADPVKLRAWVKANCFSIIDGKPVKTSEKRRH